MAVGLAVDAMPNLGFGATTVFYRLSFFHDHDFLFAAAAEHLQRGKDTGRAGTDDHDISFHFVTSL